MTRDEIKLFNPFFQGNEKIYLDKAINGTHLSGGGQFTKCCQKIISEATGGKNVYLTHSCTAALELSAILLDIKPGDEVIMPSFTFTSTANAFVLRGAVPVFVDIRGDTLNLNESLIEAAVTPRTRCIVPVHYAGVACEMDKINSIATKCNLSVVEDAAQGVCAAYKGSALGSLGDLGALSFHETKNLTSGQGGSLVVSDPTLSSRAEIILERGTDRSSFIRGEVKKYTWQEVGSSFVPGEIIAAVLLGQLEQAEKITNERLVIWDRYQEMFESAEKNGKLRRPIIPNECQHNAHIYYVLLPAEVNRQSVILELKKNNIASAAHYEPLHSSPAGKRYGRVHNDLHITDDLSERLLRLPLWVGLSREQQEHIVFVLENAIKTSD